MIESTFGQLETLPTRERSATVPEVVTQLRYERSLVWEAFNVAVSNDPEYLTFCPVFPN